MNPLEGKIVLITGAKGGLGTHVTTAFLAAGATVAGVSRSISASDFDHPRFAAFPAEISSLEAARTVVDQIAAKFQRIDALIHLVGAYAGGSRIDETKTDAFEQMFHLNVKSAFYAIAAVLPQMRARSAGRVLTISSRAGADPLAGSAAYSASKAALISLTRAVALENAGHGISANVILAGTMDTPANRAAMPSADRSKWVQPEQVAGLLVYLVLDGSANITGAAIPVYGSAI